MWDKILLMYLQLPSEHAKQKAEYEEQMKCLREKHCYTILDPRSNTWIIKRKDEINSPEVVEEPNENQFLPLKKSSEKENNSPP